MARRYINKTPPASSLTPYFGLAHDCECRAVLRISLSRPAHSVQGTKATCAQRVHDPDLIAKQAVEKGLEVETIKDYIDSFKLGAPCHGGASNPPVQARLRSSSAWLGPETPHPVPGSMATT